MAIFKKRETLTENITYMALMAAINVIFTLLTTLVPALMFLIIFVLPLASTIVALFCKKKYYPIYAIVVIGLCALVTMWNISDTFFYVIPSVISGFIFAIMVEKELNCLWIILSTTILQMGLSFAFLPLINLIYGRNFIADFAAIFGLQKYVYLDYIVIATLFIICIIQSCFSYLVSKDEIAKFGFYPNDRKIAFWKLGIMQVATISLLVLFSYVYPPLTLSLLILLILVGMVGLINLVSKYNRFVIIALVASVFISIFLFAIPYQHLPKPFSILNVGWFFVLVTIIGIVNNYLLVKRGKKSKIKKEEIDNG